MPFTEINGIDLYYEIHGHGDPLLLLHHGFGCVRMWDKIVLGLVESGYKPICYDRRGFGQSAEGEDFLDFYVSDQFVAESVNELESFRDWLGVDSFRVVGQCEGGVVGAEYAAKYPDRVSSMVISSTLCFSDCAMHEFNISKFTKTFDELDPDLSKKLTAWHGNRTKTFHNQFRQFGGAYGRFIFDLRPTLHKVKCPTLVIYPDRSFLFEVEQGVAFYRSLAQGELAVLPHCGHNTYDERPEEYVSQVVNFFGRRRLEGLKGDGIRTVDRVTCAG